MKDNTLSNTSLKTYLKQGISCVMGTDGCGLYGTDGIHEQLALINLMKVSDEEFKKIIFEIEKNILKLKKLLK